MEYYTDTYTLMTAIKLALRNYENNTEARTKLSQIRSWNMGFVFKETVCPALTVFPLTKTFLPAQSGGRHIVEYRYSIDVYSHKRIDVDIAKAFCLNIIDDVKKAVKQSIRMVDKTDEAQTFATAIEQQVIFEPVELKRDFSSSASMIIVLNAYHQMNEDRKYESKILEADYDTFFNKVVEDAKDEAQAKDFGVKAWVTKVPKAALKTPIVYVMPANEFVREERTNGYVLLTRPVTFHVLSGGYPKLGTIKTNIEVTDKIVTAIEKNYMVGGYAQECAIQSITYKSPQQSGFNFSSTIDVEYTSRVKLSTRYS